MKITIEKLAARPLDIIESLVVIWELSVRATHDFLTEDDIQNLKPLVMEGLSNIGVLALAVDEKGLVKGFMGVEKNKIEMLFIAPKLRGAGIGRLFVAYAIEALGVTLVDVNEQNPQAAGFYSHLGFTVFKKSPTDEQGNHFPILHMQLAGNEGG